ncbi:hypothetical protein [Microbacterium sp. 5K110]|uniref:hypothetical protein n=1 Tax=Microbacterium sp. 5K110 TaxID=2578104 RepID=UPI00148547C6|nr:hypothetical protein [Microbacterium sp. 5K110]
MTATVTKPARIKFVTFRTDKNGRRFATEYFRGRNFRIGVEEAEGLIALGLAVEEHAA